MPLQPLSLSQFLIELKALNLKWQLNNGEIRTTDGYCPICALARAKQVIPLDVEFKLAYDIPGQLLGLTEYTARSIACASDYQRFDNLELRNELLQLIEH